MHNTFPLYLSILLVLVTLVLFVLWLKWKQIFQSNCWDRQNAPWELYSSPMRGQCWWVCSELSTWGVADSWSMTSSFWVGWVWSAQHLQEALQANLVVALLSLNAYFVKVFFCFASSNAWEVAEVFSFTSPSQSIKGSSIIHANFDHYPNGQTE